MVNLYLMFIELQFIVLYIYEINIKISFQPVWCLVPMSALENEWMFISKVIDANMFIWINFLKNSILLKFMTGYIRHRFWRLNQWVLHFEPFLLFYQCSC